MLGIPDVLFVTGCLELITAAMVVAAGKPNDDQNQNPHYPLFVKNISKTHLLSPHKLSLIYTMKNSGVWLQQI